jgi:hypothetical protein
LALKCARCITCGLNSKGKAQAIVDGRSRPSSGSRSGFFRLPSLTDLIFVVLLIALSFGSLAPRLLWDADIGWHIRDGQNLLVTHTIPQVDSFSATRSGQPWYAWEWLYDATIGWIFNRSGLNGVVFVSALVIAATLALVFRFTLRRGGSLPVTVVLFVLCTMASSIHFLARPHVVGWLLAVAWVWILDTNSRNDVSNRRLLWLPVLMLLWANVHGGFVLGFVLLGIYVCADILKWFGCRDVEQREAARMRAWMLGAMGGIGFLASLINPYGLRLHIHVYQYLTNRFLMQHINEFRRPDLHGAPAQAFLLMIALAVVGVVAVRGRMRWVNWLLIIFSIGSGMYAARNLPFASMLLMIVSAPLLTRKFESNTRFLARIEDWRARELSLHIPVWSIAVVIFGGLVCIQQGRLLGRQLMHAHFDPSRLPVQAADVIEQQGIREPIFSLDSWGGYFIYRLYPENKVFVDDRHDFYGEPYIRNYLKVIHLESGWEGVLDGWRVNLIVMPSNAKLSDLLRHSPTWKVVHGDVTATIFQRGS